MLELIAALLVAMAPAQPYVHITAPVDVQFAQSEDPAAVKQLAAVGLDALKLGAFKAAPAADLIDQNGLPSFQVYTFDGKALEPTAVHQVDLSTGTVDIAKFFPKVHQAGTYILTWQSATPLVIETLSNPGQPGAAVVTHIVPLEYAVIATDKGDMKATLYYDVAPHTADNFISLAKQGFYAGSAFHRIIKGFMIQGGDPNATGEAAGTGGPGYEINQEFNARPHERGVLSMARSADPNSAGSQFFVVHEAAPFLNQKYTAFGKLFDGLDVLDAIANTPTSGDNGAVAPAQRPVIRNVLILPATPAMYGIKTDAK